MDTLGYGANIALAIVLLGSGALKLGREGRAAFAASAAAALVVKLAPRFASAFRASVVIVEAGVAIALLASSSVAAEVVAAVLFVSMAIVLSISKHVAPTKPCGCAGTLSVEVNVSRVAISRAPRRPGRCVPGSGVHDRPHPINRRGRDPDRFRCYVQHRRCRLS